MEPSLPPATFLLGAARSGTSLLYKALCLHPEAAYFNNWLRRAPGVAFLSLGNRLARRTPGARGRVWFGEDSNAYVYSRGRNLLERLYPMPVEGEPVFVRCGISAGISDGSGTPSQIRALRRAVVAAVGWGGGHGFINKRIANNRRIELLARAFPSSRFVELTRDGRAVALSLSRVDWWEGSVVWWYGDTPSTWRESGRDPWELCARNWVEEVRSIDAGLETIAPERVFHLTYEDLIAKPVATLRRIAAFAGLGDDPGWRMRLETLKFPNRNDTWRAQLDPETVRHIETVQRHELERRGYL
jgi:hypothetical protein